MQGVGLYLPIHGTNQGMLYILRTSNGRNTFSGTTYPPNSMSIWVRCVILLTLTYDDHCSVDLCSFMWHCPATLSPTRSSVRTFTTFRLPSDGIALALLLSCS